MKITKLKNIIRESLKEIKEQFTPGGTLFGAQGCQMCPVGEELLDYGSNWNNMIFTSGQNAGQVTCQQSDDPSGGGPDYCPNWGANVSFPGASGNWGCPVGFSTFGGDCTTPIAGGYMCPIELFPYCCHSYAPGPHQYTSVTEAHPNAQQYSNYCSNWVGEDLICYTCKGGNVVGNKFAPGTNKNYPGLGQSGAPIAACPPGWFETQAEAQANCTPGAGDGPDTDGGRLAGKAMHSPNRIDVPKPTRAELNERKKSIKKTELRQVIQEEIRNLYEQPDPSWLCMNLLETADAIDDGQSGLNSSEGYCINAIIGSGGSLHEQFQNAGFGTYTQHATAEECISSYNAGGNCNQAYQYDSYPPPSGGWGGPFIGGNPIKGPVGNLAPMGKKKPIQRPKRRR